MSPKPITVRIHDKILRRKFEKVARRHVRFLSQEVEWIIQEYILQYEKENGEILIDEDKVDED